MNLWSVHRRSKWVLFSIFMLLAACAPASQTAILSPQVPWQQVNFPKGSFVVGLSQDGQRVLYKQYSNRDFRFARIEEGKLIEPTPVSELFDGKIVDKVQFYDRSTLLVTTTDDKFVTSEFWLVDLANPDIPKLIYTSSDIVFRFTSSPDGHYFIAINSEWGADLIGLDGTVTKDLIPPGTFTKPQTDVSWSPTGRQLVYSGQIGVWIVDLASRQRHLLSTEDWAFEPSWSPRGDAIAFLSGRRTEEKPWNQAVLFNPDGTLQAEIDHVWLSWGDSRWSPDGSRLAIRLDDSRLGIFTSPAGQLEAMIDLPKVEHVYEWSPDGNRLAIVYPSGESQDPEYLGIFTVSNRVLSRVALANACFGDVLAWAPNGSSVIVECDMGSKLVRVPVAP